MAKRQGRCPNIDGCSKAMNDVIFEIDEVDDFVCPECGHELEEIRKKKKKSNPLPLIIGGAVVVIGIVVGLIFAFSSGDKEEIVEPIVKDEVEITDTVTVVEQPEATVNRNDTLVIISENAQPTEEVVAEEVVEEVPTTVPSSEPVKAAQPSAPKASVPATSSHKLSYGSWTGGWKNGQPHGAGTMTYSTSRTIDSRDPKGRVAQPGEYVVGEWDNGHLVQGRWFKKDGTKEAVIIGKAG